MKKGSGKRITVGELVGQKHTEDMDTVSVNSNAIEIMKNLNKIPQIPFDISEVEFIKPDQRVYDTLLEIKKQGEQRKKEIDLFILDENNHIIARDTETRTLECNFKHGGMNFKLIKILVDTEDFRQTRHLTEDIKSKSNESLRKKVGEINKKIRNDLKLDKDFEFVTGESGAGYKINPKIKIKVI